MLRLNTATKLNPGEVVGKALTFFGPDGYGLKVTKQGDTYIYFEGGGGSVQIIAYMDGKETSVDMETREWEHQIKEFVDKIK